VIRIRSEWIPATDRYAVYVWMTTIEGYARIGSIDNGELVFKALERDEKAVPTFVVPSIFLTALRDELNKLGPFSDSPVDWLRDAVSQRDRLFCLVEKLTERA
jgi:hypothetical protein